MPDGVTKYESKISKDANYTFNKPGVYLYQCTPHKAMGMIGIVVVDNDSFCTTGRSKVDRCIDHVVSIVNVYNTCLIVKDSFLENIVSSKYKWEDRMLESQ